jgi:hypothetical protein
LGHGISPSKKTTAVLAHGLWSYMFAIDPKGKSKFVGDDSLIGELEYVDQSDIAYQFDEIGVIRPQSL